MKNILVTLPVNDAQKAKLEAAAPGAVFTYRAPENLRAEDLAGCEGMIGNVPVACLAAAPRLEWLQLGGVGAENYIDDLPEKVCLTNARGAYGTAVAEHAFAMLWALLKKLPRYRDGQRAHSWKLLGAVHSLEGATVLVMGMGDIGRTFARMVRPFGAHVIGMRRGAGGPVPEADEMAPVAELKTLLGRADVVLMCLPGSGETKGLLDREAIAAMKDGAILLNVGRGQSVDTLALCEAVREGRLWGAGLDVTDPEPLPKDHPAWDIEDILITPHVAGGFSLAKTLENVVDIAARNLRLVMAGQPPENRVERGLGY